MPPDNLYRDLNEPQVSVTELMPVESPICDKLEVKTSRSRSISFAFVQLWV